VFSKPRLLVNPIQIKGKLGLWTLDDDLVKDSDSFVFDVNIRNEKFNTQSYTIPEAFIKPVSKIKKRIIKEEFIDFSRLGNIEKIDYVRNNIRIFKDQYEKKIVLEENSNIIEIYPHLKEIRQITAISKKDLRKYVSLLNHLAIESLV
jgi:hypothetical protein